MRDTICAAINSRNLLNIMYEGHERIVEPHLLGRKTSGSDALSAYWVGGYSESNNEPPWRNYSLDKITNISVLNKQFSGARSGYNPNDRTMIEIYCRL